MKEKYKRPKVVVVELSANVTLLAASSNSEVSGDGLFWHIPDDTDAFANDEEIA